MWISTTLWPYSHWKREGGKSRHCVVTYLAGSLADLDPVEAAVLRLVDDDTAAVKAEDVVAHAARTPRFHLMLVTEQFLSGVAAAIVQLSMRQNSKQSALASIDVPHNCYPAFATERGNNEKEKYK